MMGPPGMMVRPQRPPMMPQRVIEMNKQVNGPLMPPKRPVILQKRASPSATPSPPVMHSSLVKIKQEPNIASSPPLHKRPRLNEDECEMISMQPRSEGIPIIASVQGGVGSANESTIKAKDGFSFNDQITLTSVKSKDAAAASNPGTSSLNKNPKDVANILANRGITVTASANKVSPDKSASQTATSTATTSKISSEDASLQKLQLNSSVSIISKKKPAAIDLTDASPDDDKANLDFIACNVPGCKQKFISQDALNKHNQKGHKMMTTATKLYSCKQCIAKFSSLDGLSFHIRKVHVPQKTTADELGLPIVDLRNDATRSKLMALGIVNYIPLANLNKEVGGMYGLPVVSVQGAANSAICNLLAIGADSILSIGPVKTIPPKSSNPPPLALSSMTSSNPSPPSFSNSSSSSASNGSFNLN